MRKNLYRLLVSLWCLTWAGNAWAEQNYSAEQLDQLASPIALYPDPLLSTVTTAATHPDQIQAAAQQLKSGSKSASSSWDQSVQALYSYPEVLGMMAKNKEWTSALGWATANQLVDLMDAVQRFRYKAKSAGQLKSNDKILVIEEGTVIRVESANPEVIYVPVPESTSNSSTDGAAVAVAWGVGVATTALLYNNMYHWHDACFYRPPYGYRPPGSYYRPYGNVGYPRATPYYPAGSSLNRNVNINNINTGNVRVNTGNVRVNTGNINTGNIGRSAVNPNPRPPVARPTMGQMPAQRPAMADYSRAGYTQRASNRGSYSRGSTSYSSGQRGGGRRR